MATEDRSHGSAKRVPDPRDAWPFPVTPTSPPEHYLERATITGLWGNDRTLTMPLDRKFNFLIGKNGTGKTTVINLLAAALTADFDRLDKIAFRETLINSARILHA